LKIVIPSDKGNDAIRAGQMLQAMEITMDQLKPEAAYFHPIDGQRGALLFFDLPSPTDLVPLIEPFWLNLEADLEVVPTMNYEELKAGLSRLHV
jgi:hypothetical protein